MMCTNSNSIYLWHLLFCSMVGYTLDRIYMCRLVELFDDRYKDQLHRMLNSVSWNTVGILSMNHQVGAPALQCRYQHHKSIRLISACIYHIQDNAHFPVASILKYTILLHIPYHLILVSLGCRSRIFSICHRP